MSEETIPEDILAAAKAATGGWMAAGLEGSNAALVASVASAIQAERERCAKVAAKLGAGYTAISEERTANKQRLAASACASAAFCVASAIRSSHD